jgi:hypothetical protein
MHHEGLPASPSAGPELGAITPLCRHQPQRPMKVVDAARRDGRPPRVSSVPRAGVEAEFTMPWSMFQEAD